MSAVNKFRKNQPERMANVEKYKVFNVINNRNEWLQIDRVAGTGDALPLPALKSVRLGEIYWHGRGASGHGYERIV